MADDSITGQSGYDMHTGQEISQGAFTTRANMAGEVEKICSGNSHDGVNDSPSLSRIIHHNPRPIKKPLQPTFSIL